MISRSPLLALCVAFSACGTPQSETCQQYILCQQAYDEASDTGPVDTAQYEADGLCWQSADNAATCTAQCGDGLAAIREAAANANLDVPACD